MVSSFERDSLSMEENTKYLVELTEWSFTTEGGLGNFDMYSTTPPPSQLMENLTPLLQQLIVFPEETLKARGHEINSFYVETIRYAYIYWSIHNSA